MSTGPALPWGDDNSHTRKRPADEASGPAEDGASEPKPDSPNKRSRADDQGNNPENHPPAAGLLLEDVGLNIGSRIKVKWQLEQEDQGTTEIRWWGAKVMDLKASNEAVANTYQIMYDEQDGFEAAPSEVRFMGGSKLYDMGCDTHPEGTLRWKHEGHELDAESDEEECGNEVVTMSELHEEIIGDPEANADEEQAMQELGNLPWERQAHIASGFRDMVDAIKEGLGDIVGKGGADKTITPDDIKTIFNRLTSRK